MLRRWARRPDRPPLNSKLAGGALGIGENGFDMSRVGKNLGIPGTFTFSRFPCKPLTEELFITIWLHVRTNTA